MKRIILAAAIISLVGCSRESTGWYRPRSGETPVSQFTATPHSEHTITIKSEIPLLVHVTRKFDTTLSEAEMADLSLTISPPDGLIYRFSPGATKWSAVFAPKDGAIALKIKSDATRPFEMVVSYSDQTEKKKPNQPLQRNASTGSVSSLESPARRG